jgi:hypothetical protein
MGEMQQAQGELRISSPPTLNPIALPSSSSSSSSSFPPCPVQAATINRKRNSLAQILVSAAAAAAATAYVWVNCWGAESGDEEEDSIKQQTQKSNVRMPQPPLLEPRFEKILSGYVSLLMRGLCDALIR